MDLTAKPCLDPIGPRDFSENPTNSAQPLALPGAQTASTRTAVCQFRNTVSPKLSSRGWWMKGHGQLSSQGSWGALQAGGAGACRGMFPYKLPWYPGESWIVPEDELKCRVAAGLEVRNPFSYQGEALWGPSVQNFECSFAAITLQIRQLETQQSSPGLLLWLLVFPCHKLQFPQHFRGGLCCALPLYSPSNPRNLKLQCLVAGIDPVTAFKCFAFI